MGKPFSRSFHNIYQENTCQYLSQNNKPISLTKKSSVVLKKNALLPINISNLTLRFSFCENRICTFTVYKMRTS